MNNYEIMSGNWSISIVVKDCILPDKVESLVQEHFDQVLKVKGRFVLANEKFVSFLNQKLGHESATYAPASVSSSFTIFL
ncbi:MULTISPECIES: hypothetical protein [Metabacillus]|uniref:hypothetical protein n=1 Tax=Metabacillus TaxID=2675233 RepID=UPI000C80DECE|nr:MULTISPECIES: hypothetical protein [Metabacillus]MCM3444006.1 hypothetical protein [Metabacillus halosaccharovorans]PMC34945.1 hypothetical protein CJ195_20775 [Bacillus sp. UMB0899]